MEDRNGMSNILKTQWTITPTTAPQPWLPCSTCGEPKPFRCGNRLRLNANGKKLDAWLIYKCSICDKTWNRTLFERRNVGSIPADVMAALQTNDAGWIRRHAFDVESLRRHAQRIDEFTEVEVRKSAEARDDNWALLEIRLKAPVPVSVRLDRLLSAELGISRSRLQALDQGGKLRAEPHRKAALRRRPKDGTSVILDLACQPNRLLIGRHACGGNDP